MIDQPAKSPIDPEARFIRKDIRYRRGIYFHPSPTTQGQMQQKRILALLDRGWHISLKVGGTVVQTEYPYRLHSIKSAYEQEFGTTATQTKETP